MKNLILINNDTNIKLGDTGTLMQFKADDNNAPVSLIKGQSATFRIKNEFGFLKSIDADTTMNGYVFQFDTSALDGLVPGTYQLELAVTKSDNDVDIFPDTGFVEFTINENALSITGEQLPVMSLDDFKKQAQTYVNTQINGAETSLESNFQKYVDGIQSNTIDKANKASQDATNAVSTANSANEKAQQASSDAQNAVKTANGAVTTANAASTLASAASSMANQALTKLQQPIGTRNLLLDSRNGRSAPWMFRNMNTGDSLMNCYIGKTNGAWSKAIGAYNVYDLYQRGVYNTADTYTFSCYVKIDGTIKLRQGDISFYCTATDSNGKGVDVSNINSDTWTRISTSFKFTNDVPPQNDGSATLRFESNVSWDGGSSYAGVGTGYLYMACPQLEKGSTVSDYHPAPEDDYSMIQQMQSQIAVLTQQIATLQTK